MNTKKQEGADLIKPHHRLKAIWLKTIISLRCFCLLLEGYLHAKTPAPSLPIYFYEQGGIQPARFIGQATDLSIAFGTREVTYGKHGKTLTMQFSKPSAKLELRGEGELPGKLNFIIGQDPSQWRQGQSLYSRIRYSSLFESVDLIYEGQAGAFKSEFHVEAGAGHKAIEWNYKDATNLRISPDGRLQIESGGEWFEEHIPAAYEVDSSGKRIYLKADYELRKNGRVGFRVNGRNLNHRLVIDPVLIFSTYIGGRQGDAVTGIAVDSTGSPVLVGWTESTDFPTAQAARGSSGGGVDAFVVKLSANGQQLLWATYFGGSGDDRATSVAIDSNNNIVVGGWTQSSNFPANVSQTSFGGLRDGFLLKFNVSGSLLFSTFVGGSDSDAVNAVAVDSRGVIYAAGESKSTDFPVLNAYQNSNAGGGDAFLVSYQSTGTVIYSTLFGGSSEDRALAIAVDTSFSPLIGGSTNSVNLPVAGALQSIRPGPQAGFITRFSNSGQALTFSTYVGGSRGGMFSPEQVNALTLDSANNVYAGGVTSSSDFVTTAGSVQPVFGGGSQDGFLMKLNAAGSSIIFSSFLGGKAFDSIQSIAVDGSNAVHFAGTTTSRNLPVTDAIPNSTYRGSYDVFYGRVKANGGTLDVLTYIGGSAADQLTGLALDRLQFAYLVGQTLSTDFPISSALFSSNAGTNGGFVLKLDEVPKISVNPSNGSGPSGTYQFVVTDANGAVDVASVSVIFNTTAVKTGSCNFTYAPATNLVWMDTQGVGPQGLAGSSTVLQNGPCSIPLSTFRKTAITQGISLSVDINFSSSFTGAKVIFGNVTDQVSISSGWQSIGTFTLGSAVNFPPSVSATPAIAITTTPAVFSVAMSDPNGYADISSVLIIVNTSLNGVNACYLSVDIIGRTVSLASDSTATWSMVAFGTSASVSNSTCSITGSDFTTSGAASTVTLQLRITLQPAVNGSRSIWAMAFDQAKTNSGFIYLGTISKPTNQPPTLTGFTPNGGAGSSATFNFNFADPNGFTDLANSLVLINAFLDGNTACFIILDRPNRIIYLNQLGGGFSAAAIGSGTISNNQCTINLAPVTITGAGNNLTWSVPITFPPSFRGSKIVFMATTDQSNASVPLTNMGTFTIQ